MTHIFISYKTEQRALAHKVRDKLHEWGFDTWLDVDKLRPGSHWADEIDRAIKTCTALIGVMTPDSIKSRFVTNEWDMAIMTGKPFIPLMFEPTEPHYKYIDIQYIDFTDQQPYHLLESRLHSSDTSEGNKSDVDPYHDYLQQLYERINKYLSAKLISSLRDEEDRPKPIALSAKRTTDAVDILFAKRDEIDPLFIIGGIGDEPREQFSNFKQAFDYFEGRVLLLGEPGAGKTITLLNHARDAVVKRRQDLNAPLPILGIVPTWNAEKSLTDWLSSEHNTPKNVIGMINNGKALLFLDGLDELGTERYVDENDPKKGKFDPREKFVQDLPTNNQILLTCREREYRDIDTKVKLNGAITLNPLSDEQIEQYLQNQSQLQNFVQTDEQIKSWLNNPFLLSIFAFAYESATDKEKQSFKQIESADEFRSELFDKYLEENYTHQQRKFQITGTTMPIKYSELRLLLGDIAKESYGDGRISIQSVHESIKQIIPKASEEEIVNLLININCISHIDDDKVRFIHLLFRDYCLDLYFDRFIQMGANGVQDLIYLAWSKWASRVRQTILKIGDDAISPIFEDINKLIDISMNEFEPIPPEYLYERSM